MSNIGRTQTNLASSAFFWFNCFVHGSQRRNVESPPRVSIVELIRACTLVSRDGVGREEEGGITKPRHAPFLLFAYPAIRMKNGNRSTAAACSKRIVPLHVNCYAITRFFSSPPFSRSLRPSAPSLRFSRIRISVRHPHPALCKLRSGIYARARLSTTVVAEY